MILRSQFFRVVVVAILAWSFAHSVSLAQSDSPNCPFGEIAATARQILRCQGGLTITVESGATLTLMDVEGDGVPDSADLRGKALLLESPEAETGSGFQIVTPQAIAAVRGTKWAVDVQDNKTSVFVVRGRVAVRRPAGNADVFLGPGEGVDVDGEVGPLELRRWPAARVSALLARFGQ